MIVVRSLAEAAVWAHLTGQAPQSKRSPQPGVHVWECLWRDEPRQLVFVERPSDGPSELIRPEQFAEVGSELLRNVPEGAWGFTRGALKACVADLVLAGFCFREAGDPRLAVADARRSAWIGALRSAPTARSPSPLPGHGFVPPERLAARLTRPGPWPVGDLEGFDVVAFDEARRTLIRHDQHTLAWVSVAEGQVHAAELLSGRAAMDAFLQHGFALLEVQKARLRAVAGPGSPLSQVLELGLGEGRTRQIAEARHPSHRVRFVELETRDPRWRGALGAFILDEDERLIGHRLCEGAEGWEMMAGLEAAVPLLPGPGGERPEIEARAELNRHLVAIAQQVEPLLRALADRTRATELIAGLAPRPGDAEQVFDASVAGALGAAYAAMWAGEPPRVHAGSGEVRLHIAVSPAGLLGTSPEMREAFPRAWAELVPVLNPHRTWVCWSYVASGLARAADYDGLVWVDDHWAWFPALPRVLAALAAGEG
jgi:hypothetical protein